MDPQLVSNAALSQTVSTDCPVPSLAPLAMPPQDFSRKLQHPKIVERSSTVMARWITFGGAALLTLYAALEMWQIIAGVKATPLQWSWWFLFVLSFAWIAVAAGNAIAGLLPARRVPLTAADHSQTVSLEQSELTALLMPVYNEDPSHTCAALQAMAQDLIDAGKAGKFEIFIISDTRDPAVWVTETAAVQRLRRALHGKLPVWYRRRHINYGRKAGNVQDFVENWGARYRYMVVLDADSLMSAETLSALVDHMDQHPRLGLLQTVPQLLGGKSLFARMQQFAGFLYGPVVARGVAAWQGNSGNFWGHNAIIRVQPFAASCGLPQLAGPAPFGGSILSHDFVEAALLRRAGWKVRMDAKLGGSWEAPPPSLLDVAARDRRWAQGNMQHAKVLRARGLAWTNRAHMLIGIMSYLASPLWLALISVGLVIAAQVWLAQPEYFSSRFQLFPTWPSFDAPRMLGLFVFSMAVLLLPKLIGLIRGLRNAECRANAGGALCLSASSLLELLLSALYAPILMLVQSQQIVDILRGRDAGWNAQRRHADGSIDWRQIWRRHGLHFLLGVATACILWYVEPLLLAWLSPLVLGLLLAPWLSAYSASAKLGEALSRYGLLRTADEVEPPVLAQRMWRLRDEYATALQNISVSRVLSEPTLHHDHFALLRQLPPRQRGVPDLYRHGARVKIGDADHLNEALAWMSQDELLIVLSDPAMLPPGQLPVGPGIA